MRTHHFLNTLFLCATCGLFAGSAISASAESSPRPFFKAHVEPQFPNGLRIEGILEGSATVLVVINKDGSLQDYLLLHASHHLFGKAVTDVIPHWTFYPVEVDGHPVNSARRINVRFESSGSIISLMPHTSIEGLIPGVGRQIQKRHAYTVANLKDLDRLPTPKKVVEPRLLKGEGERNHGLQVVFHFFIDETGRVRIPVADDEALAHVDEFLLEAMHEALIQWEFTPPTIDGNPVVTRASQPFQVFRHGSGPTSG